MILLFIGGMWLLLEADKDLHKVRYKSFKFEEFLKILDSVEITSEINSFLYISELIKESRIVLDWEDSVIENMIWLDYPDFLYSPLPFTRDVTGNCILIRNFVMG
ncbi:MAG: hypothetical protein ACXAAM_09100, partial [Candidatus Heimdallarchaeaceae archaeon]